MHVAQESRRPRELAYVIKWMLALPFLLAALAILYTMILRRVTPLNMAADLLMDLLLG